jgi:hypothetical protein
MFYSDYERGVVLSLIEREVPKQSSDGQQLRFNCPFCLSKRGKPDNDYKLYVHIEKRVYHCFKCETSGKLDSSYKKEKETLYEKVLKKINEWAEKIKNSKTIKFPDGTKLLWKEHIAYSYLIFHRNIPEFVIDKREIYVNDRMQLVIFPVKEKNKLVFYQGRSYSGKRFFYNPKYSNKRHFIYGLDYIDKNLDFIVLCEGIMSSLSVPNGLCFFGKDFSDIQIEMLCNFLIENVNIKKIYIGIDNDFFSKNIYLVLSLYNKLFLVRPDIEYYIPQLPIGKDWNDVGYYQNLDILKKCPKFDVNNFSNYVNNLILAKKIEKMN